MTANQMEHKRIQLGMEWVVKVARVGLGGGLALFWRSGWDVRLLSYSVGHIHVLITESNGSQFYLTGFYGHPETQQRHHSWELLRRLSYSVQGAWVVVRDFNEILLSKDKRGGRERPQSQMNIFKMALEGCRLSSTRFTGYPFTWARRYPDGSIVEERLDNRCVTNGVFLGRYSYMTTSHLVTVGSDHYLILVDVCVVDPEASVKRSRRFHFEEMWTKEPDFDKVIEEAWRSTDGVEGISNSLSLCAKDLKTWNHVHFGNVRNQLNYAYKELAALQGRLTTYQHVLKARVEDTISDLLEKHEIMWRQRSRVAWLKEGDKNTRFFHGRASSSSKRNRLCGIFNENHVWQTDEQRIGDLFCDYFKNLFSSSGGLQMERILHEVRTVITGDMNDRLLQAFTLEELEHTLFQMFPTKAPGHDGMPALFFQKYWHIVGDKVANKCLQILNGEGSVREFNHTLIALIPKVKMPTTVLEFRPIILCTTIYKLIAKTVANRLKTVLPHVITETQSAFVPNRMIFDNVMATFEIMHTINGVKKGRDVKMALKLDMAKAYDRVEWVFLCEMMLKLGFSSIWVAKVMDCISTTTFSVLWKGTPLGHIMPQRGLWQGCSLSPYLFLLCTEGFSCLMRGAERRGDLMYIQVETLFADDSILFVKATQEACRALETWYKKICNYAPIKTLFQTYEEVSGQQINYSKSALSLSPNAKRADFDMVAGILHVPVVQCHEK
ncbi:unnamed protein product [Prunus brigantina]